MKSNHCTHPSRLQHNLRRHLLLTKDRSNNQIVIVGGSAGFLTDHLYFPKILLLPLISSSRPHFCHLESSLDLQGYLAMYLCMVFSPTHRSYLSLRCVCVCVSVCQSVCECECLCVCVRKNVCLVYVGRVTMRRRRLMEKGKREKRKKRPCLFMLAICLSTDRNLLTHLIKSQSVLLLVSLHVR